MEPMTAIKRLEYTFIEWILNYKEVEWAMLTLDEKYALAIFHFQEFENKLKEQTKMGDWPWFETPEKSKE